MSYRRLGWCLLGLLALGVGAWLWYALRPATINLTVAPKSTRENASTDNASADSAAPASLPPSTAIGLTPDWLSTVDEHVTTTTYTRAQIDLMLAQKTVSAEAINTAIDTKLGGLYTRTQVDALITQLNVLIAQRPTGEPVEFASINEAQTNSLQPGQTQSLITIPADGGYQAFIKRSNGLIPIPTSDFIPNA